MQWEATAGSLLINRNDELLSLLQVLDEIIMYMFITSLFYYETTVFFSRAFRVESDGLVAFVLEKPMKLH